MHTVCVCRRVYVGYAYRVCVSYAYRVCVGYAYRVCVGYAYRVCVGYAYRVRFRQDSQYHPVIAAMRCKHAGVEHQQCVHRGDVWVEVCACVHV